MELDKSSKQAGRSEAGRKADRQAVLSVMLLLLAAIAVLMLLLLIADSLALIIISIHFRLHYYDL